METLLVRSVIKKTIKIKSPGKLQSKPLRNEISLSRYFPKGTSYFYGYPSGEDSNFFNCVPPVNEELVAARSLVCVGEHVKPIVFSSAIDPSVLNLLKNELGVVYPEQKNIATFPSQITHNIVRKERNALIKKSLSELSTEGNLIMAQPFLDSEMQNHFQIPAELTILLNDKKNLPEYVPEQYLAKRYAEYQGGKAFATSSDTLPIPCVVKVSSSSSGDGIRICKTAEQLESAKKEYAAIFGSIIVEQFIEIAKNYGIQFGIPFNQSKEVEIIGVSEQLTTPEGEFIGGVLDPLKLFHLDDEIKKAFLEHILPTVRDMGWYGVGGFDVLVEKSGKFYMADPNFRMTGMSPYIFQARNGIIKKPMASFIATFEGTLEEFKSKIIPIAKEGSPNQMVHVIALTRHQNTFRMNAALYFDQESDVQNHAKHLISLGIDSKALRKLGENGLKR